MCLTTKHTKILFRVPNNKKIERCVLSELKVNQPESLFMVLTLVQIKLKNICYVSTKNLIIENDLKSLQ